MNKNLMIAALCLGVVAACQKGTSGGGALTPSRSAGLNGQASSEVGVAIDAPAIRFSVKGEPPLGLTSSDGTGLRLAALSAQSVVDGSLAFTEMRLVFDNPEARTLEGTFRITLPHGASLQRFAMKMGNDWQEAEVVELEAARHAYEDFLHRKQDPALLENAAGNEFSARVFPIPAQSRKELIVSYVEDLAPSNGLYTLPLKGLPEIGQLDARVTVVGATAQERTQIPTLSLKNEKPSADLVVDSRKFSVEKAQGLRAGELALVRVKPQAESKPDPLTSAIVLIDTSASRALGFEEELRTVAMLVNQAAAAKGEISVATFDQEVTPIFDGAAASYGDKEMQLVRGHGALGASNVERAILWAGQEAKRKNRKRVVLITDGVATAGANDAMKLVAAVSTLKSAGIVERLDAIATGGIRDDAMLLKLVRGALSHDGVVVASTESKETINRRLGEATRSNIPVKVEGANWAWPAKLDGVQAGDEVSIYAEMKASNTPIKVSVDDKPAVGVELRNVARPLLQRVVAQAQVASLLEREVTSKQDLRKEISTLAVRHRVLTPYTAMLVLETESDYARFHIDRRTPPDILTITDGNILRAPRSFRAPHMAPPPIEFADPSPNDPSTGTVATNKTARPAKPATTSPALKDGKKEVTTKAPPSQPGPMASAAPRPPEPKTEPPKNRPAPADLSGALSESAGASRGGSAGGGGAATHARPPRPVATSAPAPDKAQDAKPKVAGGKAPRAQSQTQERMRDDERAAEALQRAQMDLDGDLGSASPSPPPPPPPPPTRSATREETERRNGEGRFGDVRQRDRGQGPAEADPYTGRFKEVMELLARKETKAALAAASSWRSEEPGDVMALVALGEVAEALGAWSLASRAYGSILDLFPNRADMRRFAGERLERVANASSLDLAIDTFQKARADRPDHPASHHLLAFAYLRAKQPEKAFDVLAAGVRQSYPSGRFRGVDRILREDLGLAAAAWMAKDPKNEDAIRRRLMEAGGSLEDSSSLRFILMWETDANDVDFHIYDNMGSHAFYGHPDLETGGSLYADVTTGYGPECFTIRGTRDKSVGPYTLQANYYSRGPMGYGMGKLQIVDHDGHGNLTFDERPFVVMNDHAFVDLGTVR